MKRYFDTSVLFKIYIEEQRSEEAIALVTKSLPPLPLTHFHELEIKTAFRAKAQRGELSKVDLKSVIKTFQSDITSGLLQRPKYDLTEVFQRAEELSDKYAADLPCRSLDILHIAAALTLKVKEFITFDARQNAIAKGAGLSVLSIK